MSGIGMDQRALTWRRRWETVVACLVAARAENLRLRAALDEVNTEYEELLNSAVTGGVEAAKSHRIAQQRATIRRYRTELRTLRNTVEGVER